MTALLVALAARLPVETLPPSPSPSDVLRPGLDPYDVSPGLIGFLAIFAVAAVCALGWMSLNRKVRRLRFEERAAQAAGEGVAAEGAAADGVAPGDAAADGAAAGDDAAGDGGAAGRAAADGVETRDPQG